MLGSDDTKLVEEPNEYNKFVKYRHIKYAERVDSLHIIIKTLRIKGIKRRRLSENLFVIPTMSKGRIIGLLDLYKLASKKIREENIDLIVTADPFGPGIIGLLLKFRYRLPLCVSLFGDFAFSKEWIRESFHNRVVSLLSRLVFKKADIIRVHGRLVKEKIVTELKIHSEKICIVPIFTKVSNFSDIDGSKIRERYIGSSRKKIVLFAGRFTPQKDIPNLLKAIKVLLSKFQEVIFLMAGDGPLLLDMQKLAIEFGIEKYVIFLGVIPYELMGQYYSASDIFVLPSLYEDTARVLIEAALAGKAIVTTDTIGAADIVLDNKTGFVIPCSDHFILAEKLLFLLTNPDVVKRFGKKAKEHMQKFIDLYANEDKNVNRVIEIWKKALENYNKDNRS